MNVLLNALVVSDRNTGYATVIREYLRALDSAPSVDSVVQRMFVLVQRRGLRTLDPTGVMQTSRRITFIAVRDLNTPLRVVYEQLFINFYALRFNCQIIHSPASLGLILPIRPQLLYFHTSTTFKLDRSQHGRGWLETTLSNFIIKQSSLRSRLIATTTATTGRELEDFVGRPLRMVPIGNGTPRWPEQVEISEPTARIVTATAKPFVLYTSSYYRLKNHKLLISAAGELKGLGLDVVLVGSPAQDDYYRECMQEASRNSNVHILDSVSQSELAYLYGKCFAYVAPSLFEGFGLTPLEALLFNKPVVMADIPVLREVYGDDFHYFNPHSALSLVEAVRKVDDAYERFCTDHQVLREYTWEKFVKKNLDLYQMITSMN